MEALRVRQTVTVDGRDKEDRNCKNGERHTRKRTLRTEQEKQNWKHTLHHDVFPLYSMFHGEFLDDPQSPAIRYSDRVPQE